MHRFLTRSEPILQHRIKRKAIDLLSFAAFLGFFLMSASWVEATCGDYLDHHSVVHLMASPGDTPHKNVSRHSHGYAPSCKRAPVKEPVSIPVVSIEPQDRWALMTSSIASVPDRVSFVAQVRDLITSPMIAVRLDRPPKV